MGVLSYGPRMADRHQQLPQIVPIFQLVIATVLHAAKEALHGAQSDIFLVGDSSRRTAERPTSLLDKSLEIEFPDGLGGFFIAVADLVEPGGDVRSHDNAPVRREVSERLRIHQKCGFLERGSRCRPQGGVGRRRFFPNACRVGRRISPEHSEELGKRSSARDEPVSAARPPNATNPNSTSL
jgi:hypothetical protein